MNDALRHPLFKQSGAIADAKGLQAFVIGGYVRDYFLRRPCTDIDVVVTGSGIDVAETLGRQIGSRVSVFKNFGTAMSPTVPTRANRSSKTGRSKTTSYGATLRSMRWLSR